MSGPPKSRKEDFYTGKKIFISCMQGISILVIVLAIYLTCLYYWQIPVGQVRALSFITLVAGNIGVIFTNRSRSKNIFQIFATPNTAVKWVVTSASLFLVLANIIPFLRSLFQFDPITLWQGVLCAFLGFSGIIGFEFYKWRMRKKFA